MKIAPIIAVFAVCATAFAARTFNWGASRFYESQTAPVTTYPFTVSCWFRATSAASNHALVCLSYTGDARRFQIVNSGATAGDPVTLAVVTNTGTVGVNVTSSVPFIAGEWTSAIAVCASSTSQIIYVNGSGAGTNTTSMPLSGLDRFQIGTRMAGAGTYGAYFDGDMADVAVFNVALTYEEIAMLSGGGVFANRIDPRKIRAGNTNGLKSYIPLWGIDPVNEHDLLRGKINASNAPAAAEHPLFPQ